jgi:arginine/lysine/ornithine decarboxylase
VLLFSPLDDENTFDRLTHALDSLTLDRVSVGVKVPNVEPLEVTMSMRDAVFSHTETIPIEGAIGRTCAEVKVPCPPAIPIVVSGEVVTSNVIKVLQNYGIETLSVVAK